MLFKNYQYFLTIVEAGGVSKAAEKLFISQTSVSKYLKRLESNIGFELFNRESYPLRLTEAGELYQEYVMDIVAKEKQLLRELTGLRDGNHGTVKIGISSWGSFIILPAVLPAFKQQYPNITIEIQEGLHQDIASMIEYDKIDFALFHFPHNYEHITFEHLFHEPILLAVNKANPLLESINFDEKKAVNSISRENFSLFRHQPFILYKQGQNIREVTLNYFNLLSINPQIILETSNIVAALSMAMANLGITFIPGAVLRVQKQIHDLVFFQMEDPPLQWEVGIAYKTGNKPGKQAQLLIDCIRSVFHD